MDKKAANTPSGIRPGVIVGVVAVVAFLIAGKFAGWFGGQKQPGSETAPVPGQAASDVQPATPSTAPVAGPGLTPGIKTPIPIHGTSPGTAPGVATVVPGSRTPVTPPGTPSAGEATAPGTTAEMDWNDKLDNILGSNDDEAVKAEQLLAMWSTLPEDGQVETMQHITNLLPDEKFPQLTQALTNAHTVEAVLDIILGDALNRPNGLKLPTLLEVAKIPGHPKAEEALEILEVFVDHNYGTDWAQWDKAVKDWLKENPDEVEEGK